MDFVKAHLPTQRRLIQLYAALLYNAHIKGYISGNIFTGKSKILCVPGFNCYSCPGAVGACPLGALQNAIASSGSRAPTYVLGILMLYGLILGRTICGYICPLGLLQELAHKIPTPKMKKNRITGVLSYFKYVLLVVLVVAVPLWYGAQHLPVPGFCKYICPAGTFEGAIGLLANPVNAGKFSMLGILFTRKFVILLVIIAACVFIYRAFCRFLCPLGAIYGLFARVNIVGVKVEAAKCIDCGKCVRSCGMDIKHVGDHECIHCGECIDECPTKAISFKAGKITLRESAIGQAPEKKQKSKRLAISAWAAALIVLAIILYAVNKPDKPEPAAAPAPVEQSQQTETAKADAEETAAAEEIASEEEAASEEVEDLVPVGSEVGMRAGDFTIPMYGADGGSFTLSGHRGKTVVVNFWATWCPSCVAELPHFEDIYLERDDVMIVAIHSSLVTEDVDKYLENFDNQLPFAFDEGNAASSLFGVSTMLPHTIVIDADGIITYNAPGALTYEKLEALIAEAE